MSIFGSLSHCRRQYTSTHSHTHTHSEDEDVECAEFGRHLHSVKKMELRQK